MCERTHASSRTHTKTPQARTEAHTHARILHEDTHAHARIRMHTHTRKHTRAKGQASATRLVYARANTRVTQPHVQNTLERQRDPRIHRYPPPRAIKKLRRRSTLHSARAHRPPRPLRRTSDVPAPPHDCARYQSVFARPATPAPAGGTGAARRSIRRQSQHSHTRTRTHPRRPPRTRSRALSKACTKCASLSHLFWIRREARTHTTNAKFNRNPTSRVCV